jgi:hypothetical protein
MVEWIADPPIAACNHPHISLDVPWYSVGAFGVVVDDSDPIACTKFLLPLLLVVVVRLPPLAPPLSLVQGKGFRLTPSCSF